jgi:hypothetical protein
VLVPEAAADVWVVCAALVVLSADEAADVWVDDCSSPDAPSAEGVDVDVAVTVLGAGDALTLAVSVASAKSPNTLWGTVPVSVEVEP